MKTYEQRLEAYRKELADFQASQERKLEREIEQLDEVIALRKKHAQEREELKKKYGIKEV
jgi:hypothetical protein